MKKIYKSIKKMQKLQEKEAGPFFAELSNKETWTELIRWMVRQEDDDFVGQMTEVAAMAVWAIQAHQQSRENEIALENILAGRGQDTAGNTWPEPETTFDTRFGPIDRPIAYVPGRKVLP